MFINYLYLILFFISLQLNFLFYFLNIFWFLILIFYCLYKNNYKFNSFYIKTSFFSNINFFFILSYFYNFLILNFYKKLTFIFYRYLSDLINITKYKWYPVIKQYSYYGYFKSNLNNSNINYSEELKKIKY